MLKNNLLITLRSLLKHKRYSLINILGLAIGLACFILITIWVQDEISYDRFHTNAEQIYIVFRKDNQQLSGATSQRLAPALKADLPEIIKASSFHHLPEVFKISLKYHDKEFTENFALADTIFFQLFSFPFIEGQPEHALDEPNSIILTNRMCKKYFGDEEAMGKTLEMTFLGQKKIMKVTGVLKDIPHNSSIQRDFFIPIDFVKAYDINWDSWKNQSPQTYILTQGTINEEELEKKITKCKQGYYKEENISYSLMPLKKIHLHTTDVGFFSSNGDIKYVYIFSAIAVIILLMACMNYINLSNALSLKRAKEIGVKKVAGASRRRLIFQYFGETLILTCIALGVAILLAMMFLPALNQLANKSLEMYIIGSRFLFTIIFTVLVTGIISGLYPALFMSAFQPVKILKGKFNAGTKSFNLRKALIIFQFTLSIIIIISTIVVLGQLKFIQRVNLGLDKENIVCIRVKSDIWDHYEAFKNKLTQNVNILGVSRSEPLNAGSLGKTEGVTWSGKKEKFSTWVLTVDNDFLETYKIRMKEGRFFSDQYSTDKAGPYVLNEAAAKKMGLENPVGTEIKFWGREGRIIGIAQDFNFSSLHHAVEPIILRIPEQNEIGMYYRTLSVRLKPNSIPNSLTFLKTTWKSFYPNETMEYYFFDESLNANYSTEYRMGALFKYFSFLAIFIACLGLYGLTAFSIEQRYKEIGVHKVLGAMIPNVIFLFSKNYLLWIAIANIIAWPLTYYAMMSWLQNFAYRINLEFLTFIESGAVVIGIAFLTISWLSIRAAIKNPVEALRYE